MIPRTVAIASGSSNRRWGAATWRRAMGLKGSIVELGIPAEYNARNHGRDLLARGIISSNPTDSPASFDFISRQARPLRAQHRCSRRKCSTVIGRLVFAALMIA